MFKFGAIALGCLMVAACNTSNFSYSPDKFQSMDGAEFSTQVQRYRSGTERIFVHGVQAISNPAPNETIYLAPKIAHFWGTNGRLVARKTDGGDARYFYYVILQYQDGYMRRYDTVTNVSGEKLKFHTLAAYEANGGFREEVIGIELTKDQLLESGYDGLLLTVAAKEHERKVAKRGEVNGSVNIIEALRLANELEGRSNPEHKSNDNFDLSVPANYVKNFVDAVNM